jgi:large subunit ribosomal protein L10
MARQLKEYLTRDLEATLPPEAGFVAVDYRGLNSAETVDLRKSLRQAGGRMRVVPNRLATRLLAPSLGDRAANGQADLLRAIFRGPTAVVLGTGGVESVISVARALARWQKDNADKIRIKGGRLDGEVLGPERIAALARLPDQKTLRAQLAGLFQSPLRGVASVTFQVLARFAYAVNAYRAKLEKEGEGGQD